MHGLASTGSQTITLKMMSRRSYSVGSSWNCMYKLFLQFSSYRVATNLEIPVLVFSYSLWQWVLICIRVCNPSDVNVISVSSAAICKQIFLSSKKNF